MDTNYNTGFAQNNETPESKNTLIKSVNNDVLDILTGAGKPAGNLSDAALQILDADAKSIFGQSLASIVKSIAPMLLLVFCFIVDHPHQGGGPFLLSDQNSRITPYEEQGNSLNPFGEVLGSDSISVIENAYKGNIYTNDKPYTLKKLIPKIEDHTLSDIKISYDKFENNKYRYLYSEPEYLVRGSGANKKNPILEMPNSRTQQQPLPLSRLDLPLPNIDKGLVIPDLIKEDILSVVFVHNKFNTSIFVNQGDIIHIGAHGTIDTETAWGIITPSGNNNMITETVDSLLGLKNGDSYKYSYRADTELLYLGIRIAPILKRPQIIDSRYKPGELLYRIEYQPGKFTDWKSYKTAPFISKINGVIWLQINANCEFGYDNAYQVEIKITPQKN